MEMTITRRLRFKRAEAPNIEITSRDIEIINLELALSDLNQIEKRRTRLKKQIGTNKEAKLEDEVLEKLCEALENENAVRSVSLSQEDKKLIKPLGLLTEKPIIYATNLGEDELATGNPRHEFREDL